MACLTIWTKTIHGSKRESFKKQRRSKRRRKIDIIGFTKVSIALENAQLAIANALVLLTIIFVLFGQRYAPKKKLPKRPWLKLKMIAQPPCKPKQGLSSSKP